jgi:hypothetical protein
MRLRPLDVLLPCALPGLLERRGAVEGGNGHRKKALHQVGVEDGGHRRREEVFAEDVLPLLLEVEGRGALARLVEQRDEHARAEAAAETPLSENTWLAKDGWRFWISPSTVTVQ